VTDQPPHPHFRPGTRHPRRPLPAARRAVIVLGALLLSLAAATTLITLALHPTTTRSPRPPARTPARAMHQPGRQPGTPPATTPAQPARPTTPGS
jgi:hypothetical protein